MFAAITKLSRTTRQAEKSRHFQVQNMKYFQASAFSHHAYRVWCKRVHLHVIASEKGIRKLIRSDCKTRVSYKIYRTVIITNCGDSGH